MRRANISELRNRLSRYLDHVRKGGVVRVFDRDTAIAEIIPLGARKGSKDDAEEEYLDRLEREGIVTRGRGKLSKDFFTRPRPKAKASVVEALLEDREDRF